MGSRWIGKIALIGLAMISLVVIAVVIAKSVVLPPGAAAQDRYGTVMVYVPVGCFMMGSDPAIDTSAKPEEQPQFKMCFANGFWIDKTDVTNAAYQQFIDARGYKQQGTWWTDRGWQWLQAENNQGMTHPGSYRGFGDVQQPRVGVTWYEASAYCRWRGARLPTEAEWEYAARGPNSPIYPWGDAYDPGNAVDLPNSGGKTALVGSKPAGVSWVGALDMAGNVWQWTSTAEGQADSPSFQTLANSYSYPYNAKDGRENQNDTEATRAVRGGSWVFDPSFLRSAARIGVDPYIGYYDVSFRCARFN